MLSHRATAELVRRAVLVAVVAVDLACAQTELAAETKIITVRAAGFALGNEKSVSDGTNRLELALAAASQMELPFCQSAVKQSAAPALLGPNPKMPYFTVRFALPIPPENLTNNFAALTGLDPLVFTHNHSPGFEILPNGDCLAIWFSTPPGESESSTNTSFVQARLRYGAEEWDLPELFFKTEGDNDQSGLLWNDGGKIRFFGGGRNISDMIPFREAISTDNGATWTLSLPQLDAPAKSYEAQPITSAFRDGPAPLLSELNPIYFAMDGSGAHSFLWRSADAGVHWQQMPGRTGGRHSAIVPLDDKGDLLSIGGKNAAVEATPSSPASSAAAGDEGVADTTATGRRSHGWSPENFSTNFGASWSKSTASPFPPLGSGQRPSLIRLADGNLFFASDAYLHKANRPPPEGWKFGNGCFVALSTNNGESWRIKTLPVQLPNHERGANGTLGYVTARQAPNGVIHILTTETQPCLHYELNETWIGSDAGDSAPENSGGTIKKFSEKYPNGKIRAQWSARICPDGRYLLDGEEKDFYESGGKQHEVTYANGRKTGPEFFWSSDGKMLSSWAHDLANNAAKWTQYWANGHLKLQSSWNTKPEARDLKRNFFGLVANGSVFQWDENGEPSAEYHFTNGAFAGQVRMKTVATK